MTTQAPAAFTVPVLLASDVMPEDDEAVETALDLLRDACLEWKVRALMEPAPPLGCLTAIEVTVASSDEEEARQDAAGAAMHSFEGSRLLGAGTAVPCRHPYELTSEAAGAIAAAAASLKEELMLDALMMLDGIRFESLSTAPSVLPACCAAAYDATLLSRFSSRAGKVGRKLTSFPLRGLSSTAEELLAHAILDVARSLLDDGLITDVTGDVRNHLSRLQNDAFEGYDALSLLEDECCLSAPGSFLHVIRWFTPFSAEHAAA